jgi:hypothetical protein
MGNVGRGGSHSLWEGTVSAHAWNSVQNYKYLKPDPDLNVTPLYEGRAATAMP